ncbi:hypothetical protein DPMN_128414 [Dreissena polymorpha]|uniref:Uncharacterized protein n=1 Tax=Dreissena polymorpha TaxID=45954 RepID=A0A9D4H0T7_DREPO|nr:hypothetical protein DPMN_128414 [Dreissena polymorpha]
MLHTSGSQPGVVIALMYRSDGAGGGQDQGEQLDGCLASDCRKCPAALLGLGWELETGHRRYPTCTLCVD